MKNKKFLYFIIIMSILVLALIGEGFALAKKYSDISHLSTRSADLTIKALELNEENYHTQLELWEYALSPTEDHHKRFAYHDEMFTTRNDSFLAMMYTNSDVLFEGGDAAGQKLHDDFELVQTDWEAAAENIDEYQVAYGQRVREVDNTPYAVVRDSVIANDELYDKLHLNDQVETFIRSQFSAYLDKKAEMDKVGDSLQYLLLALAVAYLILLLTFVVWIRRLQKMTQG